MANLVLIVAAALLLAACASTSTGSDNGDRWEYRLKSVRLGRVLVGSQPSIADLERLKASGVTHVINLRTAAEMADRREVPYDEPAEVRRLGLAYTHLPLGDAEHPARPSIVAAVTAAIAAHDGDVLLHCQVGHRAGLVWAAHAVEEEGRSPTNALRDLAPLGLWPMMLERLLGRPLSVELAR
jgi:uncharacterized protein (TIGR01244 family)